MARHQQAHEIARLAIAGVARDHHLVDLLVVEIADGALDQRALLIDQRRGAGGEGEFAHLLPHAHQIFEVALDFLLGPRGARRAQDDAHAFGHLQLAGDFLEPLAVAGVGDLPRNAAAARGVGHQDGIAAGERQIGGERRALVAALFLDDLDQQHLTALDHFLNLVLAAQAGGAIGRLVHGVAAKLLDDFLFLVVALVGMLLGVVRGTLGPKLIAGLVAIVVADVGHIAIFVANFVPNFVRDGFGG